MAQRDLRKSQPMPDRTAYVLDAAKWATTLVVTLRAQGVEIPSSKWGISFGLI